MEKKKIKLFIPLLIIIILLSVTAYKIIKQREEKLYNVLYGEIKYQAKQCFLNGDCKEKTTLEELYNLKYLEIMYDPVTKEMLNKNTIIEYKDEEIIIK